MYTTEQLACALGVTLPAVNHLIRDGSIIYHGRPTGGRIGRLWPLGDVFRAKLVLILSRCGLAEREAGQWVEGHITDDLVEAPAGDLYIKVVRRDGPVEITVGCFSDLGQGPGSVTVINLQSILQSLPVGY